MTETFALDGEIFELDTDRNEVWPLPEPKPWQPAAAPLTLWERMVESVKGMV